MLKTRTSASQPRQQFWRRNPRALGAPLPRAVFAPARDQLILDLGRGKRVLHVGCTDAPFTHDSLRAGTLLHAKLQHVCSEVVGLDLDSAGLAELEAHLGGSYVHADATDPDALLDATEWLKPDVIIAADVIEHVGNHAQFLGALSALMRRHDPAPPLVISTPNGLSIRFALLATIGRELCHPEHLAVFTPTTLQQSLDVAGLHARAWHSYSVSIGRRIPLRTFDAASRVMGRLRPALADGLLVVAEV